MGVVRARGARAVLAIVVHNTKVHGGIPPPHGRPGIQFKHRRQSSYGAASVGGAPAIWFGSNEVWTRSANFAGGRTLNGTEHSNQGPSRTLNGMERSVRGIRGSNLGSELNFSITNPRTSSHQAYRAFTTAIYVWSTHVIHQTTCRY